MEFIVGLDIGTVIALLVRRRRTRNSQSRHGTAVERQPQAQAPSDEELITVILPTLDNSDTTNR